MLIDCQDIRAALLSHLPAGTVAPPAPTFIEGDVVLMVPTQRSQFGLLAPLQVTAVYTANSFNCAVSPTGGSCSSSALARTGISETVQTVSPITVSNP